MGFYINPDEPKEEWLGKNGKAILKPEFPVDKDMALVCLVNNGPFAAAAIAYSRAEFKHFTSPDDGRPKTWFLVPKTKICEVSNIKPDEFESMTPA